MKRIMARLVTVNGVLLMPPNPSFQLIEDGRPISNYTLDQIEELALKQISQERDPQPAKAKVYDSEEATHGNQR